MAQIVQDLPYPRQQQHAASMVAINHDATRAFVWRGILAFMILFWGFVIYMLAG